VKPPGLPQAAIRFGNGSGKQAKLRKAREMSVQFVALKRLFSDSSELGLDLRVQKGPQGFDSASFMFVEKEEAIGHVYPFPS
jgi:hypothetical protein